MLLHVAQKPQLELACTTESWVNKLDLNFIRRKLVEERNHRIESEFRGVLMKKTEWLKTHLSNSWLTSGNGKAMHTGGMSRVSGSGSKGMHNAFDGCWQDSALKVLMASLEYLILLLWTGNQYNLKSYETRRGSAEQCQPKDFGPDLRWDLEMP